MTQPDSSAYRPDDKNRALFELYTLAASEMAGKEGRSLSEFRPDHTVKDRLVSDFTLTNGDRSLRILLVHVHGVYMVTQKDVTARTMDAEKIKPLIVEFLKPYDQQRRMNDRFEFV